MAAPFEISTLARKYAPWSYSKMELAETCPAQFHHKHVAKTAGAVAPSDTKVGIVAHTVLEHRVLGKPASDAQKIAVEKDPLTSSEIEALRMLDESIEDFLRRFDVFCKAQGVTKVLAEADWGFTDTYQPAKFFGNDVYFRGKLDLGALTRDNDLYLIDHKSGTARLLSQDQKKRQQLQAYGVLALPNMPDIAGIRGGIHFMQGDPALRIQWTTYIPAEKLRAQYAPWLFEKINMAAENLTEPFEERPAKKMPRGWPCHWCNYQAQCTKFQAKWGGAK